MRRVSMRWLGVAVVLSLAGCNCNPPVPECDDLFVSFESPADGSMAAATVTATVKVVDSAGTLIDLDQATIVTKLSSAAEFSSPKEGTLEVGKATFSNVALEPGSNDLKVTVQKKGTSCVGTKTIKVTVADNSVAPKVLTVRLPQDANNDKVLNSLELGTGIPLRFEVTTQGVIGGTAQVFEGTTALGSPVNVTASSVTVDVPNNFTDRAYTFFVKVTRGSATNQQSTNPEAVTTVTFDRSAPTCMVTAPAKAVVGSSDDADTTKTGFQLRTAGSASGDATTLELKLTGGTTPQTSGPKAPVSGSLSQDFDIPSTGSVTYTISAEAKDAAGNVCTATRMVTADFEPPTVTLTSPTAAMSPYSNPMLALSATTMNAMGGSVEFTTTLNGVDRDLGTFPVAANGSVMTTATFQNGQQTVRAVAIDAAGNRSAPSTQVITVSSTMCSVLITRPAANPAFITTANYTFQVQATNCAPNVSVSLTRNGTALGSGNADGTGLATILVSGLTSGTFKLRATAGTAFHEIDVTVDLNVPAITAPQLAPGKSFAIVNRATDSNATLAGAQSTLAFTGTIPSGGRADVCSTQTPAPSNATACPDGQPGWVLKTNVTSPDAAFTFPEGTYSLRVVFVAGGNSVSSAPVDFLVDITAPTVSMLRLQNDTSSDLRLGLAELAGGPPRVLFTLGGVDNATTIASILVRDRLGTTVYNSAGGMFMGQNVTVTLDQNITATEANYDWVVIVTDQAGNQNELSLAVLNPVRIDKLAPSCAITSPTGKLLGLADDADAAAAGFQLRQTVSTSADTATVAFALSQGASQSASKAPTGGQASHDFTLAQANGTTVQYDLGATCTDLAGNATVATAFNDVDVDLDPPVCSIGTPAASPPQYFNFTIPTSINVTGPGTVGRVVTVFSTQGANRQQVTTATVAANGTASDANASYPFMGMQTVTAEVTDLAGNKCTTAGRMIDISASGCTLAFTSPTADASGKAYLRTVPFTVTASSSTCADGKNVTLFNVVGTNETQIGTGVTNASGNVSIQATLPQGGPYTLRLKIDNGGGIITTVSLGNVFVDSAPPAVASITPNATALFVVAPTNRRAATGVAGYVVDATPGGDGNVTFTLTNVTGANNGVVRVRYKGAVLPGEVALNSDTVASVQISAAFTHGDSAQPYAVEIVDEAGNVATAVSGTVTTDVIAPAAPVGVVSATGIDQTVTAPRDANVALTWRPTYDDGTNAGSGAHAGYEIRWTTTAVTGANNLSTEADYFDSTRSQPESLQPWSAANISRNLRLPPFNTYFIAVRAKDELDNYSPFAAPVALPNPGAQDVFSNPSGINGQSYSRAMVSNGSVNNDGIDDLVVGASGAGTVYVYYGSTTAWAGSTACGAGCQAITIPVAVQGDNFGNDIAVGNAGESATSDVLVGSPTFNVPGGNTGRAFLFFGGTGPTLNTTTFVQFRGGVAGGFFARSVQIIPDADGDGIGEVAISAVFENAGRGRLYVYKGRSLAAWQAAATGMDNGQAFVPTSNATWVFDGPFPVDGTNNFFSFKAGGISTVGDLNGDGKADFTSSAPKDSINKVFIYTGVTLPDGGTSYSSDAGKEIQAPMPFAGSSSNGFGSRVIGGVNIYNAAGNDLLVTWPTFSQVRIYPELSLAATPTPLIISSATALFGTALQIGRFDNDDGGVATPDLAIGNNPGTGASEFRIFYQRQNSYDLTVGQGFWQSKADGTASASAGSFGATLAVGDFNGDGRADVAISDPNTSPGRILVWR